MRIINIMQRANYDQLKETGSNLTNRNVIILPNKKPREVEFGIGSSRKTLSRIDEVRKQVEQIKQKYYEGGSN